MLAAAANRAVKTTVHFDERGAAFYALGYAKATGKPAALISTSGTAVANACPAIVEAALSCTPMIVLSADRPVELRDTGASQTVDQVGMFGRYLRWSFDLPAPDEAVNPAFVLTTVDQACYRAIRSPSGPVQLNCMFREPLMELPENEDWRVGLKQIDEWARGNKPYTTYRLPITRCDDDDIEALLSRLQSCKRGVIVAGTLPVNADKTSLIELAERLDWPLLADVGSGLRFCGRGSPNIICHYDLYLRIDEFRETYAPDLVLQLGGSLLSKHLLRYLAEGYRDYIKVANHPYRHDPDHAVSDRIEADPIAFAGVLTKRTHSIQSELTEIFRRADDVSTGVVERYIVAEADSLIEFNVARLVFEEGSDTRGVFTATSMPIREVDAFVPQSMKQYNVSANRGANGIDGTVATAVGFADGLGRPTTLLIGDLAFLHDLNSLALVKQSFKPITIVVINNDGGGIFSFLPVAQVGGNFEPFFATPHGITFRNAARLFDLEYHVAGSTAQFVSAYHDSVMSHNSAIIEVVSDRGENLRHHQKVWDEIDREIGRHFPEIAK